MGSPNHANHTRTVCHRISDAQLYSIWAWTFASATTTTTTTTTTDFSLNRSTWQLQVWWSLLLVPLLVLPWHPWGIPKASLTSLFQSKLIEKNPRSHRSREFPISLELNTRCNTSRDNSLFSNECSSPARAWSEIYWRTVDRKLHIVFASLRDVFLLSNFFLF